jgi:acetate kinase
MLNGYVVCLNPGSSSLKVKIFDRNGLCIDQHVIKKRVTDSILQDIQDRFPKNVTTIVYRFVHGGPYHHPYLLTPQTLKKLEELSIFAPLHQEVSLLCVRYFLNQDLNYNHFACFDTVFHDKARASYPIPKKFYEMGFQKYGFHGLSYEFISIYMQENYPKLAAQPYIVAHLGSGCSACLIHEGRGQDTTMGLTPLDGIVMSTRCGSIDPGVVLAMFKKGLSYDAIQDMLYRQSGLKAISGASGDLSQLIHDNHPDSQHAVDVFCTSVCKHIAQLIITSLAPVRTLVFTGGIGFHLTFINQRIKDILSIHHTIENFLTIQTDEENIMFHCVKDIIQSGL